MIELTIQSDWISKKYYRQITIIAKRKKNIQDKRKKSKTKEKREDEINSFG